jgi:hypothetical protein
MPICNAESDSASAFTAAASPAPGERSRIGAIVKYWNKMPKAKAKNKIDDPNHEHFLAEKRLPAEGNGDRRKCEGQPFGADIPERAAGAAMQGGFRGDDRSRRIILARVAVPEIDPERQQRAEQRDDRPDEVHDPHGLRSAPLIKDDDSTTTEAEAMEAIESMCNQ